jgi:transcriptional regulator with XRE-family HTH domain
MDIDWFTARMQQLGIVQEDIASALEVDRSTVSRILSGQRPLALKEAEPLAKVLQVSPVEVLEHAHSWQSPIRVQTEVRADLLAVAIDVVARALSHERTDAAHEIARHAPALYTMFVAREAKGRSIVNNESDLQLIEETLRRTLVLA